MKIVITGTSSGIGRALAEHFLVRGDHVWGIARSAQPELAAKHPVSFGSSRCDVSAWKEVEAASAAVQSAWGHVDALVCCASVQGKLGPAMSADPEQWASTVRMNIEGTFHSIRAFHPLLKGSARRAKIVCFSGGGATKARSHFSAYGIAKAAIVRLVETIALEEGQSALDINAVAPGAIHTRMSEEVIAAGPEVAGEAEYQSAIKQKASGGSSMEKALGLVDWLLSEKSDGISGRLIAAPWDPWATLDTHREQLAKSDIYMLRRILPDDRKLEF